MKRGLIIILILMFIAPLASAEIILNSEPKDVYNLGDSFAIPVTIKPVNAITGSFEMDLICNGHQINFYKNGVSLSAGEEKRMEPSLVLTKELIGETKGDCKIKAKLGGDYLLTKDFKISNSIILRITTEQTEFNPGEIMTIKGEAIKENEKEVTGFIDIDMLIDTSNTTAINITQMGTINNGFFSVEVTLPEDTKAGTHAVILNAYEKDFEGLKTNTGFHTYNIKVDQIPTSLEIILNETNVDPGTDLEIRTILHDQTGGKIPATSIITIKNENDEIQDQQDVETDSSIIYSIKNSEPAAEWKIFAVSNKIFSETTFNIIEKADVEVEIINKTLTITNTGNIPYNKSVLVKIGNETVHVNTTLLVGESQKYLLKAPDGEYLVEVITNDGENTISETVMLTGKAIDIREASRGIIAVARHPFVWIFIIAILGFVAFIIMKKGYKKTFFGYIRSKKKDSISREAIPLRKKSLITTASKAELSLSIKGEKQNANVICLKIKNLTDIESKQGNAEEVLQKIVNFAEENKVAIYENQNNLFFILAPTKTKTFDNEKTAINIAEKAKEILDNHNKLFKQKIEYGIGLNYGAIVANQEPEVLKFMSMGTLITVAKKVAALSDKEIILGEKMKEKLGGKVKVERVDDKNIKAYTIKEVRGKEDHTRFITNFIKKLEGENQEKKEKEDKENKKED